MASTACTILFQFFDFRRFSDLGFRDIKSIGIRRTEIQMYHVNMSLA